MPNEPELKEAELRRLFNEWSAANSGHLFAVPAPMAEHSPFYFSIWRAGLAAGYRRGVEDAVKCCEECKPMMYGAVPKQRKSGYDTGCENCAAAIRALAK